MLFLETGLIGLASLLLGLGLGVGASYGLSALTLSMFQMDASLLALSFSVRAAGKTALYFGLIFLLVMALNGVQVARARLIDLLQGERRNEELKPVSLKRTGGGSSARGCSACWRLTPSCWASAWPSPWR